MTRSLLPFGAALVACLLAAGCRTTPAPVAEAKTPLMRVEDLFPLRVGSRWTYEVRGAGQIGTQSVAIVGEEDGWFVDSQGGRLRVDAFGLRDPNRYLLRAPIEAGTTWSNVESVQSIEHHEIIEAGSPCTVKAGTWARCVVVRSTNAVTPTRVFVLESTFAEGVGLVAQRTLQEEKGLEPVVVLQRELVSFEPAP